jgi:FtsZ-binding cell division protein ZapB
MSNNEEIEIVKLKEIVDSLIDANSHLAFRVNELYTRNNELTKRISTLETANALNRGMNCHNVKY